MLRSRRTSLVSSWIAILAVLMATFAPTLSHAFAVAGMGEWTEICTVAGAKLVRVDAGTPASRDDGGDAPVADAMAHCPYCLWQAQTPALPPAAPAGLPLDTSSGQLPALFLAAPRTLFAWASVQPRGPPTVS